MKKIKCFRALTIVLIFVIVFAQMTLSTFAAADPTPNACITNYTDGWKSAAPLAEIVDFGTIDESDAVHGRVQRYYYKAGDTLSTGEIIEAEKANVNDKMLSFDLYVYDNYIPYEIEFSSGTALGANVLGGIYLNCSGVNSASPAVTGETAKIGLKTAPATSVAQITNGAWHNVDIVFTEKEVAYYIDGTKIGNHPPQASGQFTGYRLVSRKGGVSDSTKLDETKSGIYLDNFKTYVYSKDSQFYAAATYTEDAVTVEFSESISSSDTEKAKNVTLYNARTGEVVSAVGTPILAGKTLTLPLTAALAGGVEYMIEFANKPTGVSGNKLYSNVYFTTRSVSETQTFTEDFNNITTPVTADTNTLKAFTAFATYKDYINVSDTGETGHGNALWIAGQYQSGATMNLGVQSGKEFDLKNGEVSVEFDMKLNNASHTALYIQPYTTMDGQSETELVHAGANGNTATTAKNNQLMTLIIPPVTEKPYVITRLTDTTMYRNQARSTNNWNYIDTDFGTWYRLKLTFKNGCGYLYAYDTEKGEYTYICATAKGTDNIKPKTAGADATTVLKGLRFVAVLTKNTSAAEPTKYLYIDNVTFSGTEPAGAYVEKMRLYDLNGEEYGPMEDNLPSAISRAEITLSDAPGDINGASVVLSGGTQTITADEITLENNTVTAVFGEVLGNETDYTLTVSGISGITDAEVGFTTGTGGKFIIHNLRITDSSGNELEGTPATAGTYYAKAQLFNTSDEPKTAVIIGSVFNGKRMSAVNFEDEITVNANSASDEISVPIEVIDTEELTVKAMAWEGLTVNKPLIDAVEY